MLVAELNRSRKLGVEHEFTMPCIGTGSGIDVQRTVANVLSANGLRSVARSYGHEPVPHGYDLAIESDTSVQGERRWEGISWHSIEMKTRILSGYDDWERIVPKALEIVRYLGARVNHSCGFHVHLALNEVDTRPIVIRSLFNVLAKFEPVIYGLIAPSRKSNHYCSMISGTNTKLLQKCKQLECFQRALAGAGLGSRYCGANWSHLWGSGPRVEFRYHHGTLDPIKARHWVRTLLQITQHAVTRNCQASDQLPNVKPSLERFLTSVGFKSVTGIYQVSDELKETGKYLRKRWNHFSAMNASGEGEV